MPCKGFLVLLLAAGASPACAGALRREAAGTLANPIRRVVTMLQMMQKKVIAEGEKEAELFEKFMCYCKTSGSTLEKSIADANAKIPDLQSSIEEAQSKKAQLEEEVKQ